MRRRGVIKIPLNSVKHSRYKKINHLNGIQGTYEVSKSHNAINIFAIINQLIHCCIKSCLMQECFYFDIMYSGCEDIIKFLDF